MHSSISSSEAAAERAFVPMRLTASDRPGVAQPVPVRDIPPRPWRIIFLSALAMCAVLVVGWELYWRNYGVVPGYRNSNGQWAEQRRRIDHGEGNRTVLIGASRVLFDTQLQVWEKQTGDRPIQLALEGTSPIPILKDLADDPNFTGRLLIDVSPDVFFSGFAYRGDAVPYAHKQSPSQRIGDWLSMTFLEPYVAFYDPDFALATLVRRLDWPVRPGTHPGISVRKLAVHARDRNTHMWGKVANDPEYRALARRIWAQDFADPLPQMETPEKKQKVIDEQIQAAADALTKLRARGVNALFIRPPSDGEYYAFEQRELPRAITWDLLLQRTASNGIHFEDYPEMQGYELPEWSHMSQPEAERFTAAVVPIIEREFARNAAKPETAAH